MQRHSALEEMTAFLSRLMQWIFVMLLLIASSPSAFTPSPLVEQFMNFLWYSWDIIAFVLLSVFHIGGWWEMRAKLAQNPMDDLPNRDFGARNLNSASTAGITAVSVLIPASILIVQLGLGPTTKLPIESLWNVSRGSLWFLTSVLIGLVLMFLIPMRAQKRNVARDLPTGILFGFQLLTLVFGVVRLTIALYVTIMHVP